MYVNLLIVLDCFRAYVKELYLEKKKETERLKKNEILRSYLITNDCNGKQDVPFKWIISLMAIIPKIKYQKSTGKFITI